MMPMVDMQMHKIYVSKKAPILLFSEYKLKSSSGNKIETAKKAQFFV